MKFKVGVFGSSAGNTESVRSKAEDLGRVLADQNVTVITGACSGIPYMVAAEAYKHGCEVWGYSPEKDLPSHKAHYVDDDSSIYSKIIYTPINIPYLESKVVRYKFRNVTSTAHCDAGIIVGGRWGSMNEFTNLIDMGKVVGVLTGTGGVADMLQSLTDRVKKEGSGKVIFNSSPKELVEQIIDELSSKA